jgi:hypothetical protein
MLIRKLLKALKKKPTKVKVPDTRDLIVVTDPLLDRQLTNDFSAVQKLAKEYGSLAASLEKVVAHYATTFFSAELALLKDMSNTLEELQSRYSVRDERGIMFNITAMEASMFDTLERGATVAKVDEIRLKELYRKLARKLHPDHNPKADPELFVLAKFLYEARDVEGLYLMWITQVEKTAKDRNERVRRITFLRNRKAALQRKLDVLRATAAHSVLSAHVSGNVDTAKTIVKRILLERAKDLTNRIYGLEKRFGAA